ncbi:MAG: SapC family protein [Reyranellaceae bacterium]
MVPVSRGTHAGQLWRRLASYAFSARESYVPICGGEFGRIAATMPFAFIDFAGELVPVALLSLTPGVNLFVGPDGRWVGSYIPLLLRCYPFRLFRASDTNQYSLCVDAEADSCSDSAAATELFYDAEGNLAPATKAVFDALVQFEQNRLATLRAVAALVEAGVVCPWAVKIEDGDREKTLARLHRVDEKALGDVGDDVFLRLRKAGAIAIAYAQLLSMAQLTVLSQLSDLRRRINQVTSAAAPQPAPGGSFEMVDSDMLRFD